MMQAGDFRDGGDLSDLTWHDRAGVGAILVERKMRAGAASRGNASVTWRKSQAAVGCSVTALRTIFLRSWVRMSRSVTELTGTGEIAIESLYAPENCALFL